MINLECLSQNCNVEESNSDNIVGEYEHTVENEIRIKDCATLNDGVFEEDSDIVLEVGMKFRSVDEIYKKYKKYAYSVGFPIRRRSSRKGKNGVIRNVAFTCGREGNRSRGATTSLKPSATSQTGCKARLNATADVFGVWRVTTLELQHNHEISPSKSRMYRCNRKLTENVKRKLELNDISGIPLHKRKLEIVCSCHSFEFRGILCRHAVLVLLCKDVRSVPQKYILRRWKRDANRLYTWVKDNYDGWITTPGHEKYDELHRELLGLAGLVADDEARFQEVKNWISVKKAEFTSRTIPGHESQDLVQPHNPVRSANVGEPRTSFSTQALDPKRTKRKGAPRTVRKKGPLETKTKKTKVHCKSKKDTHTNVGSKQGFNNFTHVTQTLEYGVDFGSSLRLDHATTQLPAYFGQPDNDETIGSTNWSSNESMNAFFRGVFGRL